MMEFLHTKKYDQSLLLFFLCYPSLYFTEGSLSQHSNFVHGIFPLPFQWDCPFWRITQVACSVDLWIETKGFTLNLHLSSLGINECFEGKTCSLSSDAFLETEMMSLLIYTHNYITSFETVSLYKLSLKDILTIKRVILYKMIFPATITQRLCVQFL